MISFHTGRRAKGDLSNLMTTLGIFMNLEAMLEPANSYDEFR